MASRVYDELYAEYGRMPTEGEVLLRLERKLGRYRATVSPEDATSRTVAAAGSLAPPGEVPKRATEGARNPEPEQDPRTGAKDASPAPGARRQARRVEKPRERG
jgi:hypothetical protein